MKTLATYFVRKILVPALVCIIASVCGRATQHGRPDESSD